MRARCRDVRRPAIGVLALSSLAIPVCLLVGGRVADLAFALLAALFPVALIALGASRRGRLGPVAAPLALLALLLAASATALVALPRVGGGVGGGVVGGLGAGRLVAGLPPGAAVMVWGLGLVPFVVVVWAYAATFRRTGLTEEDLERLQRSAAAPGSRRAAGAPPGGGRSAGAVPPGDR